MRQMEGFLRSLGAGNRVTEENVVRINNRRFETTPTLREWMFRRDRLVYAGRLLGRTRNAWEPSAIQLHELAAMPVNKAWVNPQAAWLFVCGRDAFAENVERSEPPLAEGVNYLVMAGGDCLGVARAEPDGGRVILRNLFDLGDFLRRERE